MRYEVEEEGKDRATRASYAIPNNLYFILTVRGSHQIFCMMNVPKKGYSGCCVGIELDGVESTGRRIRQKAGAVAQQKMTRTFTNKAAVEMIELMRLANSSDVTSVLCLLASIHFMQIISNCASYSLAKIID